MAPLPKPNRSLGYPAIAWMEHHLVHGPGDVQGQPLEFDVEMGAFVVNMYALDRGGRRLVDEAFLSRSKGRAKSEIAGALSVFEFIGPARFDHFAKDGEVLWCPVCRDAYYEFDKGDAVGHAVTYPFIRCMATEETQAGNTYDNVTYMLADLIERHARAFPTIDLGQRAQTSTRVFLQGGGEIRPSTASSMSKDGGKETFVTFDETHLYVTPETRRMYDTVKRNMYKRKEAEPLALQTSTMYGIGEDSIAERTHKAVMAGTVERLLFDHVEAPANLDPERVEDRIKGLNVCYGPATLWMPIDKIAKSYRDPRVDKGDWIRYFWNQATAGTSSLVDMATWSALEVDDQLKRGDTITLGFDGSQADDSTALVAARISDGRRFEIKIWGRPDNAPAGWRVPRDDVDRVMTDTFNAYNVAIMFGDPNKWESYFDLWEARWPKRVAAEWPSDKGTDRGVRLLLTEIRDGTLTHANSPTLSQHMNNAALVKARLKPNQGRVDEDDDDALARYYLTIRKKSTGKIDGAWAVMLAGKARAWALDNGWMTPKPRSGWMVSF